MTFAEKLRQLRQASGLSEAKLAKASGLSFGGVHNYGLGIRKPTFEAVVKLARALGVTCEAFADCVGVGGAGTSTEKPPTPKGKGTGAKKPRGKKK
jgi:transcriptional regulator with XRE-family HTH domain